MYWSIETREAVIEAIAPLFKLTRGSSAQEILHIDTGGVSLLHELCKSKEKIRVLAQLMEVESATAKDLSKALDIHLATAYRALGSLYEMGLVSRVGKEDNPWKRGGPNRGLYKFEISDTQIPETRVKVVASRGIPPGNALLRPEELYDLQGNLKEKEIGIIKGVG